MKNWILLFLGVVVLVVAVLLFEPARLEFRHWRNSKGAEQLRRTLDEKSFQSIKVYLGKSPMLPIVVYGSVDTDEKLQLIKQIVSSFDASYQVEFRVEVNTNKTGVK